MGRIGLENVTCTGSERVLLDCDIGNSSCTHANDVGVRCPSGKNSQCIAAWIT